VTEWLANRIYANRFLSTTDEVMSSVFNIFSARYFAVEISSKLRLGDKNRTERFGFVSCNISFVFSRAKSHETIP